MKKSFAVIALIMISSMHCYASELDIRRALFDKKAVDEINWDITAKYFKDKPINSEDIKDSPIHNDYYGTIEMNGVDLKLAVVTNKENKKSYIRLYLPEYEDNDSMSVKRSDINSVLNFIRTRFGEDHNNYISKYILSEDSHIVSNMYQWSTNNTTITFNVFSLVRKSIVEFKATSIMYDSTINTKLYEPVKFIECSYDMIFQDGDKRRAKDLIIGIDYNTNKVVTDNYMETIFNIDGDYIIAKIENDKIKSEIRISRTSGKLSGNYNSKPDFTATYSGNCVMQSGKKLF